MLSPVNNNATSSQATYQQALRQAPNKTATVLSSCSLTSSQLHSYTANTDTMSKGNSGAPTGNNFWVNWDRRFENFVGWFREEAPQVAFFLVLPILMIIQTMRTHGKNLDAGARHNRAN